MRILVLVSNYPHPGHPFSGIFNEKSVHALSELCEGVEVLAPRPYVPPVISSFVPRWKAYGSAVAHETRNGVPVHRPVVLVVPWIGSAFWADQGAFIWCRQIAKKMHRRARFDAIVSFDLLGAGGMAWRIGRDLGIPASGWATGGDVRVLPSSSYARVVIRALERLDVIFYQSVELLEKAAGLLCISRGQMSPDRHIVLPRGIPVPPVLPTAERRKQLRADLGITDDKVLVLSTGRISREKGVLELSEAISLVTTQDSRITCVLVGSLPAFDETAALQRQLGQTPGLKQRVRILPTCSPDKVWEYLCAADIFAFPSHQEGMPNSLLEAMAMGVPAVAFAIPPVREIEAGTGALLTVPPFDSRLFAEAILRLSASPDDRLRIGEAGRTQILDRFMVQKNMAVAVERLAQLKGMIKRGPLAETRTN